MSLYQLIFYLLASFVLIMGFLAVSSKQIFRSAIWLLFTLVGVAGLYFWMELPFIAAVQITVYVGGIVVLIIFAIFLTNDSNKPMEQPSAKRKIAAACACLFGLLFSAFLLYHHGFKNTTNGFDVDMSRIGNAMLQTDQGGFALPFEVVSILLLAAMIGSIVIAMRETPSLNPKDAQQMFEANRQEKINQQNPNKR